MSRRRPGPLSALCRDCSLLFLSSSLRRGAFRTDHAFVRWHRYLHQHLSQHPYGGSFIGTGYEYRIAWLPGLTWKTEFRDSDYGPDTLPLLTAASVATGSTMSLTNTSSLFRSELVWRFWSQ